MTLPLRVRLTLFYNVALIIVLAAFAADVWWIEGRVGLANLDRELAGLSSTVSTLLSEELAESSPPATAAREITHALGRPDLAVALFDAGGRPLASSSDVLTGNDLHLAEGEVSVRSVSLERGAWRVRSERRAYGDAQLVLVLAASLRGVMHEQHEVIEAMWIALPLGLLLAGGVGWWIATIALRPIADMARQARMISTSGSEMLGGPPRRDELGVLASAFNGLLTRLRDALRTQRQFMADASHELRTPVSIVRTATDVALGRPASVDPECHETLAIIGTQARRLTRLLDSMLVLARADAGGYPVRRVDLYLDEIVAECCRAVAPSCDQRGISLQAPRFPETPFQGDEDLLRQLVLNVLQNAVQHTPPGGTVAIDLENAGAVVVISVSDTGPGIPAADRERIFERFVRLDAARTAGGAGLGLSIARWIAEVHGGAISLADSGSAGSVFRIELPVKVAPGATSVARTVPA
jgi:signal transduction histidine kinase